MHFFDTNVLVYALDRSEPSRQAVARELVREAMRSQSMVISTQVMLEFYATAQRRKLATPQIIVALLHEWAEGITVSTTPDLLFRAFALQQRHELSLWDAAIVQAAIDSSCDVLYTEDLQDGHRFGSVGVVNPFRRAAEVHEPAASYGVTAKSRSRKAVQNRR